MTEPVYQQFANRQEGWLSKQLRQKFQHIQLFSFEHCRTPGIPDLFGIVRFGTEFWIELKTISSEGHSIPWRPGQPAWAKTYRNCGGKIFVCCINDKWIWLLDASEKRNEIFELPLLQLLQPPFGLAMIRHDVPSCQLPCVWVTLEEKLIWAIRHKFPTGSDQHRNLTNILHKSRTKKRQICG